MYQSRILFFRKNTPNIFHFFLLALATVFIGACGDDDAGSGGEDPPILLCEDLGLGNLDENRAGGTTFNFVNNPNAPVDYLINCFPRILVEATIEPGTVIEFGNDAGLTILGDGSLTASGTASAPIIFRGSDPAPGWWSGIAFQNDDLRNELNFVTIDGAGGFKITQGGLRAALFNDSEGLKITNTTISNSDADGFVKTGANLGVFSNNTFSNNNGFPLYIHADKFGLLDGTGSTYEGNNPNMVRMAISGGSVLTVPTAQTWRSPGVPVLLDEGTLGIISDLIIEPGFELVMRPDCNIEVKDQASIIAVGTPEQPIIFRGEEDVQGYWETFFIQGTNVLNRLEYVTIANSGRSKPFGAAPAMANLFIGAGTENLTVTNCTIAKSLECGIYVTDGATPNLSANTFGDNAGGDICP